MDDMPTDDGKKAFFEDWCNLQKTVSSVKKGGYNPHCKNSHMKLNDVLDVVKKACEENNFVFIQTPCIWDEKPCLETRIVHKDGEVIKGLVPLVSPDASNPQKLGASITYMRRYSLVCMFGLEDEDDDGNKAAQKAKDEPTKVWFSPKNEKHQKALQNLREEGLSGKEIVKRIREKMAISKANAAIIETEDGLPEEGIKNEAVAETKEKKATLSPPPKKAETEVPGFYQEN